ncbi:MAG: flotillin family protein, partial [Tolypothrix sp. Co-bin9]|nr:flotillin family protein [Tolypothrix sp. Co-bin9]
SFPGANGSSGSQDINKLLLSTSGLSLINTLLDEGKLGELIGQISQLVRGNNPVIADTKSHISLETITTPTLLENATKTD